MSWLDRVREANRHELAGFRAFLIEGQVHGWVGPAFSGRLAGYPEVFRVGSGAVTLAPALDHPDCPVPERTRAVAGVLAELREQGLFPGWRDEPYAVRRAWDAPAKLVIERAAVPSFGVRGFGVHLNGYVRRGGELLVWVARRARDKPTAPGKLDQIVAGGQPAGLGLLENLVKECEEEAAIPAALARQARAAGLVSYVYGVPGGVRPDVLFVYDLELPAGFEPRNNDGEVDSFELWPVEALARTVAETDRFKFNCSLVVLDFLVRHGFISPEAPDYEALVAGLRAGSVPLEALGPAAPGGAPPGPR